MTNRAKRGDPSVIEQTFRRWDIWLVVVCSFVLAALVFVCSIYIFFLAPDEIAHEHFWSQLKDIGAAIAGFWVLVAGLLALTAAGITILADARRADTDERRRIATIRRACVGEIQAFWDRINELEIKDRMERKLVRLSNAGTDEAAWAEDLFRRNLAQDWFMLSQVEPLAIAELGPEIGSYYLSVSALGRSFLGRMHFLNGADAKSKNAKFWIEYHHGTLQVLSDLLKRSNRVMSLLGVQEPDLARYRLA